MNQQVKEEYELGVKRFYLPIVITKECKSCNKPMHIDLESNYLFYPIVNKPYEVGFYCEECDEEYMIPIILRISVDF